MEEGLYYSAGMRTGVAIIFFLAIANQSVTELGSSHQKICHDVGRDIRRKKYFPSSMRRG
jgi:hypothetical protein